METVSCENQSEHNFCRVIFSKSWYGYSPGDHFDTKTSGGVTVLHHRVDEYYVAGLGQVPRDVVKEVQIVKKSVKTVTTETFEVIDTLCFTCEY